MAFRRRTTPNKDREAAGATRAAGGSGVAMELARALGATRALAPQWTADRAFTWPWPLKEL